MASEVTGFDASDYDTVAVWLARGRHEGRATQTQCCIMPVEGQILAEKYRLERFIGSGGFASVWAAKNIAIDRPVALKILADTLARKPRVVARFMQEAKLASRSIHPVIVRVEDIGQTDEGTPFLVMELLEGRTLTEELQERGRLELSEGLEVMGLLLEGLAAAHQHGIIHRDIKPSNIVIARPNTNSPKVRILDFGLAKDLDADEGMTQTGAMMGTPDFLAPEVLLTMERTRWTPSADVFACGMLLFHLVTGQFPLKESSNVIGGALMFAGKAAFYKSVESLPGPQELDPDLPDAVDAVVRKALELTPEARYRDATEMLIDLARATDSLGLSSGRVQQIGVTTPRPSELNAESSTSGPSQTRRVHPAIWVAIGAIVATAVVGGAFSLLLQDRLQVDQDPSHPAVTQPRSGDDAGTGAAAPPPTAIGDRGDSSIEADAAAVQHQIAAPSPEHIEPGTQNVQPSEKASALPVKRRPRPPLSNTQTELPQGDRGTKRRPTGAIYVD